MSSANPTRACEGARHVDRYLDPTVRWTAAADAAMRGHLRTCDRCRGDYGRRVTLHRAMLGADLEMPSGFERGRMETALLDAAAPAPAPWWRFAVLPALAGAAVAVALWVTNAVPLPTPDPADYVGTRGGPSDEVTVGIGLSGVVAGREYEVVEGALYLDDALRITTSREVDEPDHAFIMGFQNGVTPIFYWPDPDNGELASMVVPRERSAALRAAGESIQFDLAGSHVAGRLVVVALFTPEPLSVAAVQEALGGFQMGEADRPELAAERLQATGAVVRSLSIDILPGSRRDASP